MQLTSSAIALPTIGPQASKRLERLNIFSIEDLFYHIPTRFLDYSKTGSFSNLQIGQLYTVKAQISSMTNIYAKSGKKIQIAELKNQSGKIKCIWFNQPFLSRILKKGIQFYFAGKIDWFNREKVFVSPDYELVSSKIPNHTGRLVPVYPETAGISSKWLRSKVRLAYDMFENQIDDFLTPDYIKTKNLEALQSAIKHVHFPNNMREFEFGKKRLAFNELFFLHLTNLENIRKWRKITSKHKLVIDKKLRSQFEKSLPFTLTDSQIKAIDEIFSDIRGEYPMNRLLEGDVGSGKTVVAAAGCFASFVNGFQSVIMAPTQILANQHYKTLNEIFKPFKARIALITSDNKKYEIGKNDIFVGTHALIARKIKFDDVAFVVIDEQHRFGVEQRSHLIGKSGKTKTAPHLLTMTATPIPRTVALTMYGDLSLSVLNELPKGRVPTVTWLVPPEKRIGAYQWISEKIRKEKIQAFVVCPLIELSQNETMKQVKAAVDEFEKLKKILPKINIGLLHGKLKGKEKEEMLESFKKGQIDILVSTPVVEVGIDVPNATVMLVEAAERFGLSQLHQLRGRVGRGNKKSYCLLFTEKKGTKSTRRLDALKKTLSGFELAQMDLEIRGPGEIFGLRQHGFAKFKATDWTDVNLIKQTRLAVEEITGNKTMSKHLQQYLDHRKVSMN